MNTLLLVGGDLCERTAATLDPEHWNCIGLRRSRMEQTPQTMISWHKADLRNKKSLAFLGHDDFQEITHILYAPSPDGRTKAHYDEVYPFGLARLLHSLPPLCLDRLKRCILVGSSAVWGPSGDWVDENTPFAHIDFRSNSQLDAESALHALLGPARGITLRLSGLYGPQRLRLIDGLRTGRITAPDGPGHWANRIHVDDAARACAHLLTLADPLPLYIGTDDTPLPTAQLYDALAQLAGCPAPGRRLQAQGGKRLSNARLRASGWAPVWPNALEGYAACLAASVN